MVPVERHPELRVVRHLLHLRPGKVVSPGPLQPDKQLGAELEVLAVVDERSEPP